MSLANEILSECEELAGRLTAIRVNFPDTEVRVKHTVFNLRKLMEDPTKDDIVPKIVEDLMDLRKYLIDIMKLDPEYLQRHFRPCIELVERLLGPTQTVH